MTETRPTPPGDALGSDPPKWDPDGIRQALDISHDSQTVPLPSPSVENELGLGLILGDPPQAVLELYPAEHRVLLRTPGVRLELDGVDPPTIGPEGVLFERTSPTHALWLSLSRNGAFALQRTPVAPIVTERPQNVALPADVTNRPIGGLDGESVVAGHSVAPDEPSERSSSSSEREGEEGDTEKQERVKLFGRLATQVRFKTRQNGHLIAEFVLAERLDEEQTTFHKVAAFDNPRTNRLTASKLKAQVDAGELAKGKPATVVGYRHEHQRTKKDGTTTTETQIYAVAISAR